MKFTINEQVNLQDLIAVAKFKEYQATKEKDPEISMLLLLQAKGIHLAIDGILKSAFTNNNMPGGSSYVAISDIAPNYGISTRTLALEASQMKIAFEETHGMSTEDVEDISTSDVIATESKIPDNSTLKNPSTSELGGKTVVDFAKALLEKSFDKGTPEENEFIKLVKDTLIANLKQGDRMEAIRFLTKRVFRDQNWSDVDAHRFINSLKEVENIVEPPKKPRKPKNLTL